MFEFIRTHQRLMQFLLLLLIVPSFLLVGVQSYTHFGDSASTVAKVAGQSITQQELDAAQRDQIERMRQMFGPQFDAKLFDTPEAKQSTLDNLIAQKALAEEARRNHLSVSDQALQQIILTIPGLTAADGKFDLARYKELLAAQGMTPGLYQARLRQDLIMQQITNAIQGTNISPKAVANRLQEINDQEREIRELSFKATDFQSQVKITDEMLQDFYNKNGALFEIPEQVKAEYVVLSNEVISSQTVVSDEEIKAFYEQNKAQRFTVEEQRRASHILINVKKDASEKEKTEAKTKAENLLTQIRKNPSSFAKLAKENSQDPGSAEHGGDLGFFGKGMMVKPFEDTAYKLKQGEISDLVLSNFGYHIIQVTEIKPSRVKSMDEVKEEIAAEIKKQKATKKYAELAENFTNAAYEQADSLKAVVDRLKDKVNLKIETTNYLTREPNPALAPNVPYNNPKFLKALFSDDAIKNKRNTDAVEVVPNVLVVGHVIEYKAASKRPFSEVQAIVRDRVVQREAANLARKAGEAKLAELQVKDDLAGFGEAKIVSRSKNQGLSSAALGSVMKASAIKLPALVGVELSGQGYSIYRIGKLLQPTAQEAAKSQQSLQQISNALSQQEMLGYVESLKQKAKAKITKPLTTVLAPNPSSKE